MARSIGCSAVTALLLANVPASAIEISLNSRANPIRRVVNMLENMAKKVEAEGKAEEELFEKFMCYCKKGSGSLEQSIAEAETKIPQLESQIKETAAQLAQLGGGVESAKADRADAKKAVEEATGLRAKEAAAYATTSGDMKTNIAAMGKAVAALEKGAGGAFLQTSAAAMLRKISITMEMSANDRDLISSFLATDSGSAYAPQSGEITGILKQMKDTMEADLADTTKAEEESIASFDSLMAAKAKEIEALTKQIEEQTTRNGEAGVELVNLKEDLEDTQGVLKEDKAFLADLEKNCASKEGEWAERQKIRGEEVVAIQETIKILNDDDALELFKKTLPSPSLLELRTTNMETKNRALSALSGKGKKDYRLDLISLALKGKKVSFDKVIGMIDEMVTLLGKEQADDDSKKVYCEKELDSTEDELKMLDQKVSDLTKATDETTGAIATLTEEMAALADGIKTLDKQVADATEQRKEENTEFTETTAANSAAVELLGVAKNRLNKFYNPKLYKAPPKRELSEEDRIAVNLGGGTAPPTPAPGGIAGTGVTVFDQVSSKADPGPAPETWGSYEKKGEESTGVIGMIDMLVADVEKEIQEMEVEEKNAQEEYEQMMKDSADKRTTDTKSIAEKEGAKAEAEGNLEKLKEETKATKMSVLATAESLGALHKECDWLLQNFETRKEARAGEVEALKKAKAVLSGADYSLIQTAHHALLQ